jgi:hypothetical protein
VPVFDLQVDKAGEKIKKAVSLQHLFPQIGCTVGAAGGVRRIWC